MKKETFIKAIENIKIHREREEKFLAGLDAVSPETSNETFIYCDYESLVIDILVEELDDKDEIIPWWVYDTEFGKEEELRTISVENEKVDLKSAEDLYDFLTKK